MSRRDDARRDGFAEHQIGHTRCHFQPGGEDHVVADRVARAAGVGSVGGAGTATPPIVTGVHQCAGVVAQPIAAVATNLRADDENGTTGEVDTVVSVVGNGGVLQSGLAVIPPDASATVVLESVAGEGDDGAATRGVEAIVGGTIAVVCKEGVADHHLAVFDVQPVVGPAAVGLALHPAALDAHLAGQHVPHGDVAAPIRNGQDAVVIGAAIAHRDVAQLARAAVEDQPRPLLRPAIRARGESDGLRRCAHRRQVPQHLQLGVVPPHHGHPRLHRQRHPGRHGEVALQFIPLQPGLRGQDRSIPARHRPNVNEHPVLAVAAEGVAGEGDDGAGSGGVEGKVGTGTAVVCKEGVADHHLAVFDVQPVVGPAAVGLALHPAALDAHLAGQYVPHGDVTAPIRTGQDTVVIVTAIAHRDVAQFARAAVEDQPRPLLRPGIRVRGERDGLRRCAYRLQAPQHLQLGAVPPHHGHPRFDGQGDTSSNHNVTGQDVGAAGQVPGGGLGDDAANVGAQHRRQALDSGLGVGPGKRSRTMEFRISDWGLGTRS